MTAVPITILSSLAFNRDIAAAKQAARRGPVVITDRFGPAYVLLSIETYRSLTCGSASLIEALAMQGSADIDFAPLPLRGPVARPADLA